MIPFLRLIFPLALGCALVACTGGETPAPTQEEPERTDRLVLQAATFAELPGWSSDRPVVALEAMQRSCEKLLRRNSEDAFGPDPRFGRVQDWRGPCESILAAPLDDRAVRQILTRDFRPWRVSNNNDPEGLFTGYYEPELRGSLTRDAMHGYPLYRRPSDLTERPSGSGTESGRLVNGTFTAYPDRAAIEAGALAGHGHEIVWVDDPVEAFFLHIQGSGRIRLADGRVMRVGYAGQNGHAYVPIGRILIERGEIAREDMSAQAIKSWLRAHPAEAQDLMNRNPSYIFFEDRGIEANPTLGPPGAQGVPLSPGRSLAVDRRLLPLGAPMWIDVEHPTGAPGHVRRLVVAQDTGGAIRGPVRGDMFWGAGDQAERLAGVMKSRGSYWILLPATVMPVS